MVYGTNNIWLSLINNKPYFPFQLSFVMTVNKSKGQMMPNAILSLSKCTNLSCNFTHHHLYVACSRVWKHSDNRLLLTGNCNTKCWMSVDYLTQLRPSLDSYSVLKGFNAHGGPGWQADAWDPDTAYKTWVDLSLAYDS